MYQVGDLYRENGLTGIVISVDESGLHGRLISLDEKHCNWNDAIKWCRSLGQSWDLPSQKDFERIATKEILSKIQSALILHGMPFCFGDKSYDGCNRQSHLYWTKTKDGNEEWIKVFWATPEYSGFSEDYKESEFEYVRAVSNF